MRRQENHSSRTSTPDATATQRHQLAPEVSSRQTVQEVASVTQTPWGGSTFKPPQLRLGQYMGLSFYIRAALPQIRVETLIGSQAN